MTVTIKDLAQMARTSTATVSRVLSNKPGVAEETRKNIIQLAEKLGYSPNRIAKNLALKKSHVLGFIAADLRNFVYVEFFRRIQASAKELGYQVLIADSELNVEKEKQNIGMMREHRAEGIIVFPVVDWDIRSNVDHFLQLKLQKFPFVLVGRVDNYGFDYVTSEETDTARALTQRLIAQGHREIGFVGTSDTNRCVIERQKGVAAALEEAGLHLRPEHTIPIEDDNHEKLKAMLRTPNRPTALVFVNDTVLLVANRSIAELGISVPADLSVISFSDNVWSRHMKPAITTSTEDYAAVADAAFDTLIKRIDNPSDSPLHKLVPQAIIDRESVAPPKK